MTATGIGAAVRHASAELARQPQRKKLLLVLTDGKPNDVDHYEGRFALQDTRKSVQEARRLGKRVAYFTADLNYVVFMKRFPEPKPAPEQVPYFFGGVVVNWFSWQIPSVVGLLLADAIPTQWGFGFAGTLALLGLTYSLINDRATWIAAGVSGAAAIAAFALPLKLNIVVSIAAAVAIGLILDHTSARDVQPEEDLT